jgi:predicted alpha/beta-fold hydrolase
MHFIDLALRRGFKVAFINHRGLSSCGTVKLTTPRASCAASTSDLRSVMKHLTSQYPNTLFAGVSWSMGLSSDVY